MVYDIGEREDRVAKDAKDASMADSQQQIIHAMRQRFGDEQKASSRYLLWDVSAENREERKVLQQDRTTQRCLE